MRTVPFCSSSGQYDITLSLSVWSPGGGGGGGGIALVPPYEQKSMCKNITFSQLRLRAVINHTVVRIIRFNLRVHDCVGINAQLVHVE